MAKKLSKFMKLEDHYEQGLEIQAIRSYLMHLEIKMAKTYGVTSTVYKSLRKILSEVDKLRSTLDGRVFIEHPTQDHDTKCNAYYAQERLNEEISKKGKANLCLLELEIENK